MQLYGESRMREIRTSGLMRGKSHWRQRRGVGLYSTRKASRVRRIRRAFLTPRAHARAQAQAYPRPRACRVGRSSYTGGAASLHGVAALPTRGGRSPYTGGNGFPTRSKRFPYTGQRVSLRGCGGNGTNKERQRVLLPRSGRTRGWRCG